MLSMSSAEFYAYVRISSEHHPSLETRVLSEKRCSYATPAPRILLRKTGEEADGGVPEREGAEHARSNNFNFGRTPPSGKECVEHETEAVGRSDETEIK